MTPPIEPLILHTSQFHQASEVLGRALHDDPPFRYIFPVDDGRVRSLPRLLYYYIRYGSLYGAVYATEGLDAVAVWVAPNYTTVTFARMLRVGLIAATFKLGLTSTMRFMNLADYSGTLHKSSAEGPHWYLSLLGVEPTHQGKGIGSELLKPFLKKIDADGFPCYLETWNERNLQFYERHGFKVVVEGLAPKNGLQVWGMWRDAIIY